MHYKFNLIRGLAISAVVLLLIGRCGQQNGSWKLLDGNTKAPIEGALIFQEGSLLTYRSDIRGEFVIDLKSKTAPVSIHAKNFVKMSVSPRDVDGPILLNFDETRVNSVEKEMVFTKKDSLRGSYGAFRENNDLRSYDLSVRIDPEDKYISGNNIITFTMLTDDDRIQLDLFNNIKIDSIFFEGNILSYERQFNAVFVDFPTQLLAGQTFAIDFHYSGYPQKTGRFGGLVFEEDSLGNPWIFTANQGIGASVWWPNKDQQRDEVDSMTISISIPSDLVAASNGRFQGKSEIDDGYTRYDWKVHYPINNYSVSLNIAKYVHFSESLGDITLDYFVLPYHLEGAKRQFAQVIPMLECFQNYFGPYPFPKDGYKLIEVNYSGMEHQSAVTYGNGFKNGYTAGGNGGDWTGVGISLKFDFIIIHESGHEWYGNSVTANDVSDAWIQEGWETYAEAVYVECLFGYEDAMTYVNGYQGKVRNREPIIGPTAVNHWPTGDQYFKGALLLNTLRHVVDDDTKWWALIKDYTGHFQYQNIWTTDVINYFNAYLGTDLRPIFEQYLYHWDIPTLEYRLAGDAIEYHWQADVADFNMPVGVMIKGEQQTLHPTKEWQSFPMKTPSISDWEVQTNFFYINVSAL